MHSSRPPGPPGSGEDSGDAAPATSLDFTRSIVTGARYFTALEAQEAIQEGSLLFGRYRVLRELGRGGMGQVWLVRHVDLDTLRALKVMYRDGDDPASWKRRFRREARLMASFNHPHAVTVHDARFANDMTFIDMEFIAGRTLTELLQDQPRRPLGWTAHVLEQVCDVLQVAHDRGVVHRDIKPSNIMSLDGYAEGREFVKLLDFGIARVAGDDQDEVAGQMVGTVIYISPEQIVGEAIDHRSDLYNLGVTLYEILSGARPFGGSMQDIVRQHMNEVPRSLRSVAPELEIPEKIDDLILSCLAKDPADRPRSARELAERFVWALPPRFKQDHRGGMVGEVHTRLRPPPGYMLKKQLGVGGFGEVWEALDEEGVRVALKYVRLDDEHVGRTEWDALQIIKNIRHPNLLVPFKSLQSSDHLILFMELADGTLMHRFSEAKGRGLTGLPKREVIELLQEAAKGLDFLNSRSHSLEGRRGGGIYHCDVKPQNILLMGGAVKVADFGLSKFTTHSLTDREAGWTILYAAPEMLNRKAARQSDQYSLAVVYCQVRGGQLPFVGTTAEVMTGHLMKAPNLSMLPPEERPIVLRALSKDPRARFPSCSAFIESLAKLEERSDRSRGWWKRWTSRLLGTDRPARDPSEKTTEPWDGPDVAGPEVFIPPTRGADSSTTGRKLKPPAEGGRDDGF